jgi:hypothetical protein
MRAARKRRRLAKWPESQSIVALCSYWLVVYCSQCLLAGIWQVPAAAAEAHVPFPLYYESLLVRSYRREYLLSFLSGEGRMGGHTIGQRYQFAYDWSPFFLWRCDRQKNSTIFFRARYSWY